MPLIPPHSFYIGPEFIDTIPLSRIVAHDIRVPVELHSRLMELVVRDENPQLAEWPRVFPGRIRTDVTLGDEIRGAARFGLRTWQNHGNLTELITPDHLKLRAKGIVQTVGFERGLARDITATAQLRDLKFHDLVISGIEHYCDMRRVD